MKNVYPDTSFVYNFNKFRYCHLIQKTLPLYTSYKYIK